MPKEPINRHFVSEIDEFIGAFNRAKPLSESQKQEIAKHERISRLRDNADVKEEESII